METPLYKTINHANQTKDRSVIETLGPYGCLLYNTVLIGPKDNVKAKSKVILKSKDRERNAEGKPLIRTVTIKKNDELDSMDLSYDYDENEIPLKVFEGDDPHELAVKFCEEHKPNKTVQKVEEEIKKIIEDRGAEGHTTLYRGLGLPKAAL